MNKNNSLFIIVPHRGLMAGKSRLGAVLDDDSRADLNRWLLLRTLKVIHDGLPDAHRCLVVSPCSATLALARDAGAATLAETATGLNPALAQAAGHAVGDGARALLVLPSDLPRLDAAALQALSAMAETGAGAVIAPDRHGSGSNALWVSAPVYRFAFGENSLAKHRALACEQGLRVMLCRHAALAFDLDTPEDFYEWQRSDGSRFPLWQGGRVAA